MTKDRISFFRNKQSELLQWEMPTSQFEESGDPAHKSRHKDKVKKDELGRWKAIVYAN
jgi:hypothetical protein